MPGQETGMHKHLYDYIVTPVTAGKLLLVDKKGNQSDYILKASHSYFRRAGVVLFVFNNGKKKNNFAKKNKILNKKIIFFLILLKI